jgi:hypothetical protein
MSINNIQQNYTYFHNILKLSNYDSEQLNEINLILGSHNMNKKQNIFDYIFYRNDAMYDVEWRLECDDAEYLNKVFDHAYFSILPNTKLKVFNDTSGSMSFTKSIPFPVFAHLYYEIHFGIVFKENIAQDKNIRINICYKLGKLNYDIKNKMTIKRHLYKIENNDYFEIINTLVSIDEFK